MTQVIFLVLFFLATSVSAGTFESPLSLKLYEFGFNTQPDRFLGSTTQGGQRFVSVPSRDTWYVRPGGTLSADGFIELAEMLRHKKVPGLDLSNHWDVTNQSLAVLEGTDSLRLLLLAQTRVTDAGLAHLATLPGLKYLALNNQTSDAGLRFLKGLENLEYLYLHRSKMTDAGLLFLKDLPRLKILDIGGTRVTNAGAKTLGTFRSLRQLDISDTAITDKGLAFLSTLSGLQTLYANQRVTDAGLKQLTGFKKLKALDLSGAPVTSAGVAALGDLKNLEELALSGTRIDDRALKHLARLKHLRTLELSFTEVTTEGLTALAGLKRLETISLSWGKLTESDLHALSELPSIKTVILNGEVVEPQVLARITALAKANALKHKRPDVEVSRNLAGVAPTSHPGGKTGMAPALYNSKALSPSAPTPSKAITLPPDLAPTPPKKTAIAMDSTSEGPGIEIEVSASRNGGAMRGLKRIHHMEITHAPKDTDLSPGANKEITFPRQTPENSLGEITVPAHRK